MILNIPCLAPDGSTLPARSAEDIRAAKSKWLRLRDVLAHMAAGCSLYEAARRAGVAVTCAWRWNRAYQAKGLASLLPPKRAAKPSALDRLGVTAEIVRGVEMLSVRFGNSITAWRQFAASSSCPPRLQFLASAPSVPEALRAAVRFHEFPAKVRIGREFACVVLDLPEP